MNFTAINPSELDKALALRLAGASETGLYALASRAMSVVTLPVVAMLLSAQPRIFRDSENAGEKAGRLIGFLIIVAFVYGVAVALLLRFVAPSLLELVFGDRYIGIAEIVEAIALIAPFMCVRFAAGWRHPFALGRPWARTGIESLALALMVLLTLLLAPGYGIMGIIWAVLSSEAFMACGGCLMLLLWGSRVRPVV